MKAIPLAVAVILALAAGGFAWQRHQALGEAQAALANTNAQLQKAQADLKALTAEVAPLRKELAEQKAALEKQRADLAAATTFLDAERASTARLREELSMAKEQMAFMMRSRAAQSSASFPVPAMVRPQQPMVIRAAPSAGAAQGAAVQAR